MLATPTAMLATRTAPVIVIGGGLAGLAAATRIAHAGEHVILLEKSDTLGGRARSEHLEGFTFNLGPHALYRSGPAERVLTSLAIPIPGHPVAGGGYAIDGGVKHTLPAGAASMLCTSLFTLTGRLGAVRLLAGLSRIDPAPWYDQTLRSWVEARVRQPTVRRFLYAIARLSTYCESPDQVSAGSVLEQLKHAASRGVSYLDGGWQSLIDGLRRAAAEAGVEVRTAARAERIEVDDRVRGVVLANGERLEASAVMVAAGPKQAAALVPDPAGDRLRRWAEASIPVKAACLDLALSGLPRPRATFALGIDVPLYLSVHSAVARLAPDGGAMVHVAKYLRPGERPTPEEDERALEGLMDLVQPGWRAQVVERRFLPALTVAHALPTAAQGGVPGRPGPAVPGIDGLYVAGDWVGQEGMLADASLGSADRAAALVLEYLREARALPFSKRHPGSSARAPRLASMAGDVA